MPSRNQAMIRRDINRLFDTATRNAATQPALAAILPVIATATERVNTSWQQYQSFVISGNKERQERDLAIQPLLRWIQRWRPVIFLLVPGAETKIRALPAKGATPDDIIRVAEDMAVFIQNNPSTVAFRADALNGFDEQIANARKETSEATAILPLEAASRQAFTDACLSANAILFNGTEIIRAIFGRTSREYKQFIARNTNTEEDEIAAEAAVGEE